MAPIENDMNKKEFISNEEAIRFAKKIIEGRVKLQENIKIDVKSVWDRKTVTFGINIPEGVEGPDFAAQLVLDAYTGELIGGIVGSPN